MTDVSISHERRLDRIGRGGMGVVYKAKDTRLSRSVAFKFLPGQRSVPGKRPSRIANSDSSSVTRFHTANA